MAELNVVRKKKPVWPWILLALIVLGLLAFLLLRNEPAGTVENTAADTTLSR